MSTPVHSRIAPALAALAMFLGAGLAVGQPSRELPVDDVSYAIGHMLGEDALARLRADGVTVNNEEVLKGFAAALNEEAPRLDEKRRAHLMRMVEDELRRLEAAERLQNDPAFKALAESNLKKSQALRDLIAKQPDILTTASGLQIQKVTDGAGEKPTDDSVVVASFRATRLDGFDFATGAMEPVVVRETVPGVQEFLKMMPAGSHWRVAIPPALAFGELGLPPNLGPNETIIVDVTLHEVRKAE